MGYIVNTAQFEAMEQAAAESGGATVPAGIFSLVQNLGTAGVVFGLLWAWALPVFMWIWLSRRVIRAETAEWS